MLALAATRSQTGGKNITRSSDFDYFHVIISLDDLANHAARNIG